MKEESVDFKRLWDRICELQGEIQHHEGLRHKEWPLFFYCALCDTTFPGSSDIATHFATHHPNEKARVSWE